MPTLNRARVALIEARMTGELAELVRRFGGTPHVVPEHPKMVPMVAALAQLIESRDIPARGPE